MQTDQPIFPKPVLLLGGGPVDRELLTEVLKLAPDVVAADGGANHMSAFDHPIQRIIGDLDSLTNLEVWRESGTKIDHVMEQDSTDFEKCVQLLTENHLICVGFLGGRLDHELAALKTLVNYPQRLILMLGREDAVVHCPRDISLDLPVGTRLSLFPMGPLKALHSEGLRWPLNGLEFSPMGQIGTSNEVTGPVRISLDREGMVLMVPRAEWRALQRGLIAAHVRAETETDQR